MGSCNGVVVSYQYIKWTVLYECGHLRYHRPASPNASVRVRVFQGKAKIPEDLVAALDVSPCKCLKSPYKFRPPRTPKQQPCNPHFPQSNSPARALEPCT